MALDLQSAGEGAVVGSEVVEGVEPGADACRFRAVPCGVDHLELGAFNRALEIQRHALDAGFHRALSLPDLLIATTAELNQRTVLHYDGDFDMIASLTGQPTEWVVPPGS